MFPEGENGRIPIVAVTGTTGTSAVTRLIELLLDAAGKAVGMACEDGIYVNSRRIVNGNGCHSQKAREVLLNPAVEAAVLETPPASILDGGLGFDRCDVAVVTRIGELVTGVVSAPLEGTVVKHVARTGATVLNASDPRAAAMAAASPAPVVYFARTADHPVMARHLDLGGKVAFVREGAIIVAEGGREHVVASLGSLERPNRIADGEQVEDILAATAAAWEMGIPCDRSSTPFTLRCCRRSRPCLEMPSPDGSSLHSPVFVSPSRRSSQVLDVNPRNNSASGKGAQVRYVGLVAWLEDFKAGVGEAFG